MKTVSGFPNKFDITLTCASGLEKALKSELLRLNYGDLPFVDGATSFSGGIEDVCRLNLNLRTADRVYIKLKSFTALTFDDIFDNVYSIPWGDYIDKFGEVLVDGKCAKSKIFAVTASQKTVKKAIAEKMKKTFNYNAMPESGERYYVQFRIVKDTAEILLNTSGAGLHKRGYRDLVGVAPIKETLASALVLYSDYYYKNPFLDPFCGSGTIAIEAAKIALNIAPQLNRSFDFNSWKNFPQKQFDLALEEARDREERNRNVEIFASDIDKKAVSLAKYHAERAGLKDVIKFDRLDVKDFKTELKNGTVVTNPPYGERSLTLKDAESCYKDFGRVMAKLDSWSKFVITPVKSFEKCFGKRADRKKKLYNSDKECYYYYYYGNKEKN